MQEIARHQRHQRRDRAADQAGQEGARQHDLDRRRIGDVARARDHGAVELFARQARRLADAIPQIQHDQQRKIEHRIDGEGRDRAGGGDDDAADRGAEAAGDVVADAVQRDRRGQRLARHLLADRGLPGRPEQRHAAADDEAQHQQQIGRQPGRARPAPSALSRR